MSTICAADVKPRRTRGLTPTRSQIKTLDKLLPPAQEICVLVLGGSERFTPEVAELRPYDPRTGEFTVRLVGGDGLYAGNGYAVALQRNGRLVEL